MRARRLAPLLCLAAVLAAGPDPGSAPGATPTDNPVASHYGADAGWPAWTDRIRWSRAIDMAAYAKGRTAFEKFENARDELAAAGGGVLYYPAGTYDFSEGPFDGPAGRGLMLPSGVAIRGQAPTGRPRAADGRLELPTKFVFGFQRRADKAVDVGRRLTLVLADADIRIRRRGKQPEQVQPTDLILDFAVAGGKVQPEVRAFRRGLGRDVWKGEATVKADGASLKIATGKLPIPPERRRRKKDPPDWPQVASYELDLEVEGNSVTGSYTGTCRGRKTSGKVAGRMLTVRPETPRAWNVVGLRPPKGGSIKDVDDVGIAWVHLIGATVYFGPEVTWGQTWATAGSWKSRYVKPSWADRVPDGTHPWDPFAGGGKLFVGSGAGRLVFGCVLEHAAVLNDMVRMGRPDDVKGFGDDGFYMHKFGPRIGVYGSDVLVANNLLPLSRGRNFKYRQRTRRTWPKGGAGMGFDPPRESTVFFDCNKTCGVQINKTMLGLTKDSPTGKAGAGFFAENVVVIDNHVFNNGHKGFDVSGSWVIIAGNRNERAMLREGWDPERLGGWELTLDGHLESSPGGNGAISDNLSRAFDLAGRNLWVHRNTYNNLGSDPGNDGEGILCQAHGGSQVYSWAITRNRHDKGDGETGYIGGWDVNMAGALFGWNDVPGWIGSINVGKRTSSDAAFTGNEAGAIKPMPGSQVGDGPTSPTPPGEVAAAVYEGRGVRVAWTDRCEGEVGFRVDRRAGEGAWRAIAYRPPRIEGHPDNPQVWIDFLAPSGVALRYRVVALNVDDDDAGASQPAGPVTVPPAEETP